jgi:hypothetical protein
MAVNDPTMGVPTPRGVLQGAAAFSWDGSAWQPSGRASSSVATPTGVLAGVAPFNWSGGAWQPTGRAGPGVPTPTGVLEGVAVYTWDGSAWVPPYGGPGCRTPTGVLRGVAGFTWDGTAWQPSSQAGAEVPTPYGVLEGMAMFSWTGSGWTAGVEAAALDLSFMTPGTLDPRITFSRAAGSATYIDATGTIQTAGTNVPRFDYDPLSHALRGLLIEEARTNLVLNSATLSTQSVTVTAAAHTLSFYGTGTITYSGTASGALVGTGASTRVAVTFTPTAGSLTLTVTGSVTNAQIELGAFATSYIPTTGTTATRPADVATITNITAWFNSAAGTLLGEFIIEPNRVTGQGGIVRLDDGTATTALSMSIQTGTNAIFTAGQIASVFQLNGNVGVVTNGTPQKVAATYGPTIWTGCSVGQIIPGGGNATPLPVTTLRIGGSNASNASFKANGWLRRVQYWPRALSSAQLQAVTI